MNLQEWRRSGHSSYCPYRAYLVLGPESSGTRLMTRILIDGGCTGDDGHVQRWDTKLPEGVSPIVWRRSVPHGGTCPDVANAKHTEEAVC